MKKITFLGDSIDRLRDFPLEARKDAGYQLHLVQIGENPEDWKPLKTVGPNVREIRIKDATGIYRVIHCQAGRCCLRPSRLPEEDTEDQEVRP